MTALLSCRALAARARHGSLATLARTVRPADAAAPFVTLVALAFDGELRPLMCLSMLAEHTKNLLVAPRASVLVAESAGDDPLASGRMTLTGECARVPDNEVPAARAAFLGVHPEAAGYVTFADFAMWRMKLDGVWWVGGFGRMQWVKPEELAFAGEK